MWLAGGAAVALLAAGSAWALPIQAPVTPQVNAGGGLPIISSSGPDMTVDLNAQRTIIDWSSFNVANGESIGFFVERAGAVILNRVASGAINIDGRVNTYSAPGPRDPAGLFQGGNLWLYSPDGVIFGPNARVITNDLLATSSAVDPSQFLNASNLTFDFKGSGRGGPVIVRGGAQLSTKFGHLALVAPMVTTEAGSVMTGDNAEVFYGAADSYRIRFMNDNNDDFAFSIVDFIVPTAADGTPAATALNLAGVTNARDVSIIAISRAQVAGLLINAPGLIVATASAQSSNAGNIIISTGENKRNFQTGFDNVGPTPFRTTGATAGSASFGDIRADHFLTALLHSDTVVGDFSANSLRAGAQIFISAHNLTLGAQGAVAGFNPAPIAPNGININLDTSGLVTAPVLTTTGPIFINNATYAKLDGLGLPTVNIGTATSTTGEVNINSGAGGATAGTLTAATRVIVGGPNSPVRVTTITAPNVTINSNAITNLGAVNVTNAFLLQGNGTLANVGSVTPAATFAVNFAGAFNMQTPIVASQRVSISTGGGIAVGSVSSGGDLILGSNQTIRANTVTSGALASISSAAAVTVNSIDAARVTIGTSGIGNVTLGSVKTPLLTLNAGGALEIASLDLGEGTVGANGLSHIGTVKANIFRAAVDDDFRIDSVTTTGILQLEADRLFIGTATAGGDARIGAGKRIQINGSLTAPNVVLQSFAGPVVLGGAPVDTDLVTAISNDTFQKIRVTGAVSVYGGLVGSVFPFPAVTSDDMTVLDLTIDPAKVPRLNLLNAKDYGVEFLGTVRTTAPGAVLVVGEPAANSVWTPAYVRISGAVGTAKGDVVTGFTEVQGFKTVEFYTREDIGFGSDRFIDLVEDLPGDQINIAENMPMGVAPVGDEIGHLFLVAGSLKLSAPDRIVSQNTGTLGAESGIYLTGEGVDATAPVLTIVGGKTVDLFGSIGGDRGLAFGQRVSLSSRISRVDGPDGPAVIRINGCGLGVGCAIPTPAAEFRVDQFSPPAPRAAIDAPVLTPPPPLDEDEKEAESVTAGTGNEEIWRRDK